jgi:hypothetical protein
MTTAGLDAEHEFLAAARRALRTTTGTDALDTLGWWDLLPRLDDGEHRTAALALFRAQGRELACTAALGGLMAAPYLAGTAATPGSVTATVPRQSARRGTVAVVVGDVEGRQLLVDRPGHGAWVAAAGEVGLRRIDAPGRLVLHEVAVDAAQWQPAVAEDRAAAARVRSTYLGRVALALEVLGAAEAAVEMAVSYAGDRRQFGQPIGTYQAVRHLLAWGRTDCVALEHVARQAARLDRAAPPMYGEVVKALAGRNGRRACERALQVLGGIGFTAEHDHHHFHGRALALDALLGTSAHLTHSLGARLRSSGTDPGFPAAVLLAGGAR